MCGYKEEHGCSHCNCDKIEAENSKHYCDQCEETHPEKKECPQCLACLYKYAKQIPDNKYPIFECTQCGKRVFWD
jgi:hypothetical protein